jgi:hypothetical protein
MCRVHSHTWGDKPSLRKHVQNSQSHLGRQTLTAQTCAEFTVTLGATNPHCANMCRIHSHTRGDKPSLRKHVQNLQSHLGRHTLTEFSITVHLRSIKFPRHVMSMCWLTVPTFRGQYWLYLQGPFCPFQSASNFQYKVRISSQLLDTLTVVFPRTVRCSLTHCNRNIVSRFTVSVHRALNAQLPIANNPRFFHPYKTSRL